MPTIVACTQRHIINNVESVSSASLAAAYCFLYLKKRKTISFSLEKMGRVLFGLAGLISQSDRC